MEKWIHGNVSDKVGYKKMKFYFVFSPVMIDRFTMKQYIRITKTTIKFIVVFGRWTRMFGYCRNALKTHLRFPNK